MTDHLWAHPRLSAALQADDWAAVFRTFRQFTGWSQTKLGARVGLSQPDVSDIERGRRKITSAEVRARIIAGLGVPATVAPQSPVPGLALPGIAPDADLLERVTSVVKGGKRADGPTLDWLDRLLAEHRRAEDFVGSRPMVDVMRQ